MDAVRVSLIFVIYNNISFRLFSIEENIMSYTKYNNNVRLEIYALIFVNAGDILYLIYVRSKSLENKFVNKYLIYLHIKVYILEKY